jgi:hypothetical protein
MATVCVHSQLAGNLLCGNVMLHAQAAEKSSVLAFASFAPPTFPTDLSNFTAPLIKLSSTFHNPSHPLPLSHLVQARFVVSRCFTTRMTLSSEPVALHVIYVCERLSARNLSWMATRSNRLCVALSARSIILFKIFHQAGTSQTQKRKLTNK